MSIELVSTLKKLVQEKRFVFITIIIGIGLRLAVATRGNNFDFDSYLIVIQIMKHGGNVYAETTRYNYGPMWAYILFSLYSIALRNITIFRYLLTVFLSFIDTGIFVIIWRKINRTAAYLFFFNPISIIITGYHNQFDNLAILLAMVSTLLIGDNFNISINKQKGLGIITLGLSLVTKHLFFVFPLWLAIKQKGIFEKLIITLLPASVFLLSFIPFWQTGGQGIIKNVLLYQSYKNEFFYKMLVPFSVQALMSSEVVWILILIIGAFLFKNKNGVESLLFYTCLLVATSPATTNQYLAIVIPFIAVNPNIFSALYTIIGTWYLLLDGDGLHLSEEIHLAANRDLYYATLILLLIATFSWTAWKDQIIGLFNKMLNVD